ncbi:MAG: sugar transferase [Planctomycetes bacterium]|nr:sugar transferase [Planctomycetota bacterium]
MQTVTIIPDCFICPGDNGLAPTSVLALPLGCGTVLDYLCESAAQIGSRDIWIVRDESVSTDSMPTSRSGLRIRALLKSELTLELRNLEPSDLLLFVDPRHWPAEGFSLAHLKQHLAGLPGAVHSVAMGADPTGAIESLQLDDVGRVRRIRRLYEGVTQTVRHRGIVTHSLMPAAAMDGIDFVSCRQLPASLAQAGVVSRYVVFCTKTKDLTIPGEYLAHSNSILDAAIRGPLQADYCRLDKRILLGRGAHVHETARLSGSIIIQKGCTIQEGAVIIGPALIGANSRVGRNAIVAQSVVPMHAAVEDLTSIRHAALGAIPQTIDSNNPDFDASVRTRWDRNSLAGTEPHNELPNIHTAGLLKSSIKRCFDFALALIALIIALPVMIVAAILIKLDSRGPLFLFTIGRVDSDDPSLV